MTTISDSTPVEFESPESAVSQNFRWPSPPYSSLSSDIEQTDAEPCRMALRNGSEISGRLIFFLPEHASLHYQIPPSRTALTLSFEALKTLQLL
jgi:hypothetical protein